MNKALLLSKRADGGCSVYCFQEVAVYWRAADRFDSLKLTRTGYIQPLSKKERSLKNQINRHNKREERYIVVAEMRTLAFSRFVLRHFLFFRINRQQMERDSSVSQGNGCVKTDLDPEG